MEVNRIVLHKITIKKAKKFENKSVVYEKDLENIESESTIEHNLSNDAILDDISLETNQDVINIFPKNITMAGDGEHQIDDLKEHKKCELSITILEEEEENKSKDSISNTSTCNTPQFDLSMFESSPCPTVNSNCSLPVQSSFALFESESSVQDIKYDKLQEESNTSARDWCAEWEKDLLSDYSAESDISFLNYPASPCTTVLLEENRLITIPKYFDDSSVKLDCSKKSDEMQESVQSGSTDKNLMKQLKKSLENSTNCLVKYLEKLERRSLKREKLRLKGNSEILESNTSVCTSNNSKIVVKEKEANSLNASSYILKDSTNSTLEKEYLIQVDKSKNITMESSNAEHSECGCNCCNGKCLHFQRVVKKSNDDVLKEAKKIKKKAKTTVSEIVNVSDKFNTPNIEMKKYQSEFDLKKQNLLPLVDIPKLFEKEPISESHGDGFQNKLIQSSYPAAGDFLCENSIPSTKESVQNVFKQRRSKECDKRNSESKLLTVFNTNNDNEDGGEKIEDKQENQYDRIVMIYLAIFLIVPMLLFFQIFILLCS